MLKSIIELLGGLFLSALPLLIGSCMVGSIVAALRAVSGGRKEKQSRSNERPSFSSGWPTCFVGLNENRALGVFQRVSGERKSVRE
jgi:hypothetical protein